MARTVKGLILWAVAALAWWAGAWAPARAAALVRFPPYDAMVSRHFHDVVLAVDGAAETLGKWRDGKMAPDEAIGEIKAYQTRIHEIYQAMKGLDVGPALAPLHKQLLRAFWDLARLTDDYLQAVRNTDLESPGDQNTLDDFLREASERYYQAQFDPMKATIAFQRQYDFRNEPPAVRDYYRWNDATGVVDLALAPLQKALGDEIAQARSDVNGPRAVLQDVMVTERQVKSLAPRVAAIKPPPALSALHKRWVADYRDLEAVVALLKNFIRRPSEGAYKKIITKLDAIKEKETLMNEAMLEYMEAVLK